MIPYISVHLCTHVLLPEQGLWDGGLWVVSHVSEVSEVSLSPLQWIIDERKREAGAGVSASPSGVFPEHKLSSPPPWYYIRQRLFHLCLPQRDTIVHPSWKWHLRTSLVAEKVKPRGNRKDMPKLILYEDNGIPDSHVCLLRRMWDHSIANEDL